MGDVGSVDIIEWLNTSFVDYEEIVNFIKEKFADNDSTVFTVKEVLLLIETVNGFYEE